MAQNSVTRQEQGGVPRVAFPLSDRHKSSSQGIFRNEFSGDWAKIMSSCPVLPDSPQVQGPKERLSGQASRLAGKEPSPVITTQEVTQVET